MSDLAERLAANLKAVRRRIALAAKCCDRDPDSIKLVAVTKGASIDAIRAAIEAGCLDLGESRPQELERKAEEIGEPTVRWHLIGHLQRNKVRRTLPLVSLVHSIDSLRLLETIQAENEPMQRMTVGLLEVNISGDEAKHGFKPAEMPDVVPQLQRFPLVQIRGLMTMATLDGALDAALTDFGNLRSLRDELQKSCPPGILLSELSMGMTGDLEAAITEGATIVRVGTALFKGLP
jgi:pyridoxal phosphate enzyme (YggS family)